MDKTYVNDTDGVLNSRNPRLALQPGESLLVTPEMMSYSVRMWIRSGELLLDQSEAAAKPAAAEPGVAEPVAAKPTAAKKPAAKKPAAKPAKVARIPAKK